MQGGHAEDAFAACFVGDDLDHHRERFGDEDAAHQGEDEFLADGNSDGGECRAESEGADVAHEDEGWMGVVPEEAESRTGNGSGEDGHFACTGDGGLVQVVGEVGVAGDIGEDGEATGNKDDGHDGETS